MPDLEEYSDKLKAMTVCDALELEMNQLNEVGCAFYVRHANNANKRKNKRNTL